jgi:Uncharacterised BCR, YnfA/UPF0060 family
MHLEGKKKNYGRIISAIIGRYQHNHCHSRIIFLAALMEIGGGYLVWQWIREKKGVIIGFIEGHSFIFMWYNSYTPTISFWKNLCRVRRYIHYFVNRMGNDCG